MKTIITLLSVAALAACATNQTNSNFNLEPYKALSCNQLYEKKVQIDIEIQSISRPSSGAALVPILGWAYYAAANASANSKYEELNAQRIAIRSQQPRCSKVDL